LQWADRSVRLHETVRAMTWKGYPWAVAKTALLLAKRLIKRSPPLWEAAVILRKYLAEFTR
jgi:hypothetical protein